MLQFSKKFLFIILAAIAVLAAAFLVYPSQDAIEFLPSSADDYQVKILRDTWGVPHVFGKTDADAVYGLAYAHAEDDFPTIQNALLAARGKLAAAYGEDLAPNDYMVQLFKIWDFVDAKYETELSPETRAICEAYAAGINQYAREHPDAIVPEAYPITGKDIVAGFVHKVPLFFNAHLVLQELFEEERKREVSGKLASLETPGFEHWRDIAGSNAFAVSPKRSEDGKTLLAINSHQPWEGPVAWYEAHLHSEEGLDIVGGVFPGAPVILHGHNRDLGWAHTVNMPDLVDVYVLEINPDNPNQYRYDGEWRDLESRMVPIDVKLFGLMNWTFEREALWSIHGPVVRRPHGTYAIRFSGFGEIRQIEQWFRMNKSRNFEEWHQAMKMSALPMFNTVYADREGSIYYIYNGQLPMRAEGYDWSQYVPGNVSETLWEDYLSFADLPQVLNPDAGYLQNCNSSPFQTTGGTENPDINAFSTSLGIETNMTNRALRIRELFEADPEISEAEFYDYKYDMAYSQKSPIAEYVKALSTAELPGNPLIDEAVALLTSWDLQTDPDNTIAALGIMSFQPLVHAGKYQRNVPDSVLIMKVFDAARKLQKAYKRLEVPWKDVNRLVRGEVNYGMGGGPDILHAVHSEDIKNGRLRAKAGDSYILMVSWDENGEVSSKSIHQFGSATLDDTSPHYADQAPLFAKRQMKPVWMDEADIRANLEREYSPGQEPLP